MLVEKLKQIYELRLNFAWLRLFIELATDKLKGLEEHIECVHTMSFISTVYLLGERALQYATQLREATDRYFDLFSKLYPACVKKKLHVMLHIPHVMASLQLNLTTLPCERKHRAVKQFAHFSHGVNVERTYTKRVAAALFEDLERLETFQRTHPETRPVPPTPEVSEWLSERGLAPACLHNTLRTGTGPIKRGDVLCFESSSGLQVGAVACGLACQGGDKYMLAVKVWQRLSAAIWVKTEVADLVDVDLARTVLPYVHSGAGYRLLLPAIL